MNFNDLYARAKWCSLRNKLPMESINESINNAMFANEDASDFVDSDERAEVLNKINNDEYIEDDYESFSRELNNGKRRCFLTRYTPEELKEKGIKTYQVPGYEIGFALNGSVPGDDVDIVGIHNNSDIKHVGDALIQSAKRLGGTTLDHFDGFLSDLYKKHGFEEYERYKWDDQYAPGDWDYETYGKPDVIMRRLKKES